MKNMLYDLRILITVASFFTLCSAAQRDMNVVSKLDSIVRKAVGNKPVSFTGHQAMQVLYEIKKEFGKGFSSLLSSLAVFEPTWEGVLDPIRIHQAKKRTEREMGGLTHRQIIRVLKEGRLKKKVIEITGIRSIIESLDTMRQQLERDGSKDSRYFFESINKLEKLFAKEESYLRNIRSFKSFLKVLTERRKSIPPKEMEVYLSDLLTLVERLKNHLEKIYFPQAISLLDKLYSYAQKADRQRAKLIRRGCFAITPSCY